MIGIQDNEGMPQCSNLIPSSNIWLGCETTDSDNDRLIDRANHNDTRLYRHLLFILSLLYMSTYLYVYMIYTGPAMLWRNNNCFTPYHQVSCFTLWLLHFCTPISPISALYDGVFQTESALLYCRQKKRWEERWSWYIRSEPWRRLLSAEIRW